MSHGGEIKATAAPRAAPSRNVSVWTRLFGRRRRLLVNPRYQLRASILAVVVVFTLLLLLNVSLFFSSVQSGRTVLEFAPELGHFIRAQERVQLDLILLGSLVFLLGVFLISFVESHKTAGAAFNLGRRLRDIQTGHYYSRLSLRRRDGLREVEDAFNNMARALSDRTWEEIETLRELGDRVGELPDDQARAVASTLHSLAERKRKLVEP
jgi:methyl-accepting chemotaxis protein